MWWVIEVVDRFVGKSVIFNDGIWIIVFLEVLMRF